MRDGVAGRGRAVREMFREFWPYTRGDRLRLLAGGLLGMVLAGCELASVAIFEAIVSKVLERHHLAGFWALAGAWLAVAAMGALAMTWSGWLTGLAAERIQLRLRDSVFSHLDSLYAPLVYFIETCSVLVIFGVGAWDIGGGRLSVAGLLAFAACLAYLYPPVQGLTGLVLSVSEAAASAARIDDILSVRPAVVERRSALQGRLRGRGRIDVENVTFGYPHGRQPVLERLTFTAAPGRLLAITGPSGAGKSTIARLLLRFHDPDAGRILIDGIDIRELSLRTLRYNVTLLQQEALLFPGTVADNIRYGRTGACDREVAAAARAADAHAFITALPEGYDTVAGQRGRLLSGGQRQRICLARAFLRDAPVLVLDEPTAGLDAASAQRLLEVIRRFAAGHTTIVITHDARIAAAADDVLQLRAPDPNHGSHELPCSPSPGQSSPVSWSG